MTNLIPILLADSYKISHHAQYPKNTTLVYSNLTARSGKYLDNTEDCIFVGLQYFIKEYLVDQFNKGFFDRKKSEVISEYARLVKNHLGKVNTDHIEELHDLGYLPIKIKALPEGSRVPIRTPMLVIYNTDPRFFWLTNALETLLSNVIWKPIVSATIADKYRQVFNQYADETCDNNDLVQFQGHDFSMRGMAGIEGAVLSGFGHICSFSGSDTVPVIPFVEQYYNANSDNELVAVSVPATEHSVQCLHGVNGDTVNEDEYVQHMLNTYPTGIISVVSDGFDYWRMLTETLPKFKDRIMSREGKYTVRPDSGNPVDIVCGTSPFGKGKNPEEKGSIEVLWDTFGGTTNSKGYKELDPHIGLIYGDSITMDRQKEILKRLKDKGFASNNIVLGIGSFTYSMNTRDTLGIAVKATYGEVDGEPRPIFKDPKTDDGMKRSARGLIKVNEDLTFDDNVSWEEEGGLLTTVFQNGMMMQTTSLQEIRERICQ